MHTLYIKTVFSSNIVQLVPAYASSIPLIQFSVATSDVRLWQICACKYHLHMLLYDLCEYITYTQCFHKANTLYFWSFWIQVHMGISWSVAVALYTVFIILVYHYSTQRDSLLSGRILTSLKITWSDNEYYS